MIKFPEEANYDLFFECKPSEECKKTLERTLKKLGNFEKKEPITVTNYKHGKSFRDFTYEIKDLNNTVFKFNNYGLEHDKTSGERYNENFYIMMQRENSNFSYKYDFHNMNYSDYEQVLRMIEVSYQLCKNRKISLKREIHRPINIVIEENSKKYILAIYNNEEFDEFLLENFENMIIKLLNIDVFNLKNILEILPKQDIVNSCYIYYDNLKIANLDFNQGNLNKYEIYEANKKIKVYFYNKITRVIEKSYKDKKIMTDSELTPKDYDQIKSEYTMLLKRI